VRRVRLDGKPGGFGGPVHERVERHRPRSVEFPGPVPPRRASASVRSARRSAAGDVSGPARSAIRRFARSRFSCADSGRRS
jgi:hypothetical protein